jgi:membrane-bound metal-dependent hydrolase YbcI (DUF457 family)
MPTPVGHALAGLAVAGLFNRSPRLQPAHLGVLVLCATAPDLDLLLRFIDGVNHHRAASHSFAMAALVGLACALCRRFDLGLPSGPAAAAAWATHVVLDYLGRDNSPPIGLMALWPLSADFFASPVPLFYDIPRNWSAAAIRDNTIAVLFELAVLAPLALLCWRGRLFPKADTK